MHASYLSEFLTLATLHLLVLISPGANFTLVVKNSLVTERRFGILTALGIALGTAVYVALALGALSWLLALTKSAVLFALLKVAGASYLIYLGVKSCRAKATEQPDIALSPGPMDAGEAVRTGLFSQLSNPKAMLFFGSVFTQAVDFHTPLFIKFGYGVWMSAVTFGWFALVAYLLSFLGVQRRLREYLHWISRAFGVVLIGLGILLILS